MKKSIIAILLALPLLSACVVHHHDRDNGYHRGHHKDKHDHDRGHGKGGKHKHDHDDHDHD
jgi:hypothetical protein